ncbi:MAG: FUSC family protein [Chthoniobacter sp.]|uniref:FUSC family protein n=1 Tax=Chthoniobacter sp. TaxID=2510640 RepID=UPI0032A1AB22
MKTPTLAELKKGFLYPARTTVAAVAALLAARALGMAEYYWAPVSAVIVVQSDFGSSLQLSWQRLVGTAIGVTLAAVAAESLGRSVIVYACGLLCAGLLSVLLRLARPANRFAAIAFTIVFLVQRAQPPWVVALHRFVEVSLGIVAGLLLSAVWPEPPAANPQAQPIEPGRSTPEPPPT